MILSFKIVSPNNTGAPNYNICGQAAPALSHSGLALKMEFNGVTIYDEADVSMGTLPALPIVIGSRSITGFSYHPVNGFSLIITSTPSPYIINVEDQFTLTLSKTGYQSFSNTFKLFDYDFNTNIYLINNTNNLDINGRQTRAFSKFYAYRRPFTDEVYYYNVVGTQGSISYDTTDSINSATFTGQNGIVCASTGVDIRQTIVVRDVYNNVLDTCSTVQTIAYKNWLPKINAVVACAPACDDACVSNIATGNVMIYVDTSELGCITVDGKDIYPFHLSPATNIITTFYDYQGNEIDLIPSNITLWDCGSGCPESPLTIPVPVLPQLGDVLVKVDFQVQPDNSSIDNWIIKCSQSLVIGSCNWYRIEETEVCGEYIVKNCSLDSISVTVNQLQEDMSFSTITTIIVPALSNVSITLQEDGVYTLETPSKKVEDTNEIFIVINDCKLKACLFNYLNVLICNKTQPNCSDSIKDYYDFNSFILNMHTYFALLNEEYNFNYIYTSIGIDKVKQLYTIKQYLDSLLLYCGDNCSPCKDCN